MTARSTPPRSSTLLRDAIDRHIESTGRTQKSIAYGAGLQPNFLSMVKKNEPLPLDKVLGLCGEMPELDAMDLTVAALCEAHPEEAAQQAICNLMEYFARPARLARDFGELVAALQTRFKDTGLQLPEAMDATTWAAIERALSDQVQRDILAEADEAACS